jgi:hypothetical protein
MWARCGNVVHLACRLAEPRSGWGSAVAQIRHVGIRTMCKGATSWEKMLWHRVTQARDHSGCRSEGLTAAECDVRQKTIQWWTVLPFFLARPLLLCRQRLTRARSLGQRPKCSERQARLMTEAAPRSPMGPATSTPMQRLTRGSTHQREIAHQRLPHYLSCLFALGHRSSARTLRPSLPRSLNTDYRSKALS